MFSRNKQIKVIRKNDNSEVVVNSIAEAVELTGLSEGTVRGSLDNPFHYSHMNNVEPPVTARGTLRKRVLTCAYEFEYIYPTVVSLVSTVDGTKCDYSSHHKAIASLGVGKSTYYRVIGTCSKLGEPCELTITDKSGTEWLVVLYKEKEAVPEQFL